MPDIQNQLRRHVFGSEAEKLAIEEARRMLPVVEEQLKAMAQRGLELAAAGQIAEARAVHKEAERLMAQYNEYSARLA